MATSARASSGRLAVGAGSRLWPGRLGLAGLLLSSLLISIGGAHSDALLPESVRPIPAWLAGPFQSTGLNLGRGGVIAVLGLMFVAYVISVRAADRMAPRTVLMTIAALHALLLLAPPLLSTDVFSYHAYARMWTLYGANPYLQGPHAIALDSVYPFIGSKWVTMPTAYGPLFTALSGLLAPLSIAGAALASKAVAALASLTVVALVYNAARLRGLNPVRAVMLVGCNPLVVVYGVGGGHNDLLMVTLVMASVYCLLAHRDRSAGASVALAAAVKLTGGLLLPFAAAECHGLGARSRRRELALGAGAALAGTAVLGFLLFGSGPIHLLGTLQRTESMGDWHSIAGFISTGLGLRTVGLIVGVGLGGSFVGLFAWLVRRVWRREIDWIDAAGWATVALLITAGSILPWYVAWLMPLAALGTDRRLRLAALSITGGLQAITLVDIVLR